MKQIATWYETTVEVHSCITGETQHIDLWVWKQIIFRVVQRNPACPSMVTLTSQNDFWFKNMKGQITTRQNMLDTLQWTHKDNTPHYSAHIFPGSAFFEKQIPWPGESTHMQIGAARVFSITCCDLHSWFVFVPMKSHQWSGRSGRDKMHWPYIYYDSLYGMTCIQPTDPKELRTVT